MSGWDGTSVVQPMRYLPLPEVAIDGVVTHPRPFEYTSYTITVRANGQHDSEIVFHPGEQRFKLIGTGQLYEGNDSPHDRHDQMVIHVEPFEEDRPQCDRVLHLMDEHGSVKTNVTCTKKLDHAKRDDPFHSAPTKKGRAQWTA